MKLARDVASGLGHSFWSMVVGLAVVPFYISYLGTEAYGLIGFSVTLQGLLQLLDLGLAPAISRQVARVQVTGKIAEVRNLLHSLSYIYWATALVIGVGTALAAPLIARHWLNAASLSEDTLIAAITLTGLLIASRWPSGLYLGALQGAHRVTTANVIAIGWTTASNLGGIVVLAAVSASIEALFLWQAAVGIVYTLAMRAAAWRALRDSARAHFDIQAIRQVWRFAAGMSGVALTGIVFSQLDKVIVSKLVPLSEFGYYMLATTLASILYRLIVPLFNAVSPRFAAMVAAGNEAALARFYRMASSVFAAALFPAAMALTLCARPLILLWTQDPVIADRAAPLLILLTIGSAMHSMMYFPYALQLAYGRARLALQINGLLMLVQLPLLLVLTVRYGAVGGASAWAVLHLFYLVVGTWLTHRQLLPEIGSKWLFRDVGVPLAVSATFGAAGGALLAPLELHPVLSVLVAGCAFAIAWLISASLCTYKPAELRTLLSH